MISELNEPKLKDLIKEELGISDMLVEKSRLLYKFLVDDLSDNKSKFQKNEWFSSYDGGFKFYLQSTAINVSYRYKNYFNKEIADKFKVRQDASSVMVNDKMAFMFLDVVATSGSIDTKNLMDGIQHELEHIYQQTMIGDMFSDSETYPIIITMMNSNDEFKSKVGRLLYGCVRSEQDGFINGIYAYMMSVPEYFKFETLEQTEGYKLYREMVSIYNELGDTKEFADEIRNFGYTKMKVLNRIIDFQKKIARVVAKVQKDKIEKQGFRF